MVSKGPRTQAEKYADRIQQHLEAKEKSFSIDADNQSFPPSISGIQNGIVAYAMNQRKWKAKEDKVDLTATSNVATLPNNTWAAEYDFTAKYQAAQVKPEQADPDGEYMIGSGVSGTAMLDISGASKSNGANAQLWKANGSGAQRFRISYDESACAYEIVCMASGLALDVYCADFVSGANVQQHARNGSAAVAYHAAERRRLHDRLRGRPRASPRREVGVDRERHECPTVRVERLGGAGLEADSSWEIAFVGLAKISKELAD